MSFRCERCKTAQPPGERPIMVVTQKRERTYSTNEADIPGWEIAKEERVCRDCQ